MMRIAIIMGTRPEIIKMSPVIRACDELGLDYFILHTGQHYSYNLDKIFFEELELPGARYNLDVGSNSHGKQTGEMLIGIEKVLQEELPSLALVEGDTNTVLAGALAAAKLHIKLGHVEAGLRSCDRNMPEEINRIVADHVSDYLFAPTENAKRILLGEGMPEEKNREEFGLKASKIRLIEPLGFLQFLQLEANTALVLTDSGGVQEEACILQVPCVTLRDKTERPETVEVGSNMLAGTKPENILWCAKEMVGKRNWENPFGDGKSGERIMKIIREV